MSPRLRGSCVIAVLVLGVCYAALLYAIVHARASRFSADGRPMFSAVVSDLGERRAGMLSRPFVPAADQMTEPPRHWMFPPIDFWPSPPGWSATLSEFTPVTDAKRDPAGQLDHPSIGEPFRRRSVLRMVRWLRPDYPESSTSPPRALRVNGESSRRCGMRALSRCGLESRSVITDPVTGNELRDSGTAPDHRDQAWKIGSHYRPRQA
jgi:hypothetical protein